MILQVFSLLMNFLSVYWNCGVFVLFLILLFISIIFWKLYYYIILSEESSKSFNSDFMVCMENNSLKVYDIEPYKLNEICYFGFDLFVYFIFYFNIENPMYWFESFLFYSHDCLPFNKIYYALGVIFEEFSFLFLTYLSEYIYVENYFFTERDSVFIFSWFMRKFIVECFSGFKLELSGGLYNNDPSFIFYNYSLDYKGNDEFLVIEDMFCLEFLEFYSFSSGGFDLLKCLESFLLFKLCMCSLLPSLSFADDCNLIIKFCFIFLKYESNYSCFSEDFILYDIFYKSVSEWCWMSDQDIEFHDEVSTLGELFSDCEYLKGSFSFQQCYGLSFGCMWTYNSDMFFSVECSSDFSLFFISGMSLTSSLDYFNFSFSGYSDVEKCITYFFDYSSLGTNVGMVIVEPFLFNKNFYNYFLEQGGIFLNFGFLLFGSYKEISSMLLSIEIMNFFMLHGDLQSWEFFYWGKVKMNMKDLNINLVGVSVFGIDEFVCGGGIEPSEHYYFNFNLCTGSYKEDLFSSSVLSDSFSLATLSDFGYQVIFFCTSSGEYGYKLYELEGTDLSYHSSHPEECFLDKYEGCEHMNMFFSFSYLFFYNACVSLCNFRSDSKKLLGLTTSSCYGIHVSTGTFKCIPSFDKSSGKNIVMCRCSFPIHFGYQNSSIVWCKNCCYLVNKLAYVDNGVLIMFEFPQMVLSIDGSEF